jgi:hypothetical protein
MTKHKRHAKPYYRRHWGSTESRRRSRLLHHLERFRLERPRLWWRERRWWQKLVILIATLLLACLGTMYGIARWYIASQEGQPLQLGTTFVAGYAESFGLDPQETLHAIIYDLGVRHIRLVSYWDKIETSPGRYDFSQLDWQFKMAQDTNTQVSLAIGLRQPRWPECHMPAWAANEPDAVWSAQLKTFMGKVIERYKGSPSLQTYQLENEFFLKAFGQCTNFSRQRLIDEFNFVKKADPHHPVIISRSNNALGVPIGEPTPDIIGVSVYKRVWDKTLTHRYFEYPFPAWFYAFLAGADQIATGKNTIIHELQAEPWLPPGFNMSDPNSSAEAAKSMNPARLKDRIQYGEATGMKTIDLWGSEYWYFRKVKLHDPGLWNTAKTAIHAAQDGSAYN